MIRQKRLPRWRAGIRSSDTVLVHRGLRYFDTKLREFANNARGAPQRICAGHPLDELADLLGNRSSAGLSSSADMRPIIAKPFALPGDHCRRLNEDQSLPPS